MRQRALELRQVLVRVQERALQYGQPRIRRELLARRCQPFPAPFHAPAPFRAPTPVRARSRKARARVEEPECAFARRGRWARDDEARAGVRVERFQRKRRPAARDPDGEGCAQICAQEERLGRGCEMRGDGGEEEGGGDEVHPVIE